MQGLISQNILMVSEVTLKNFTDIDNNISSEVILPFVTVSQQKYIEYIIGGRYYQHLLQAIKNNNLTTIDANFLNYFCVPLIIWGAYLEALPSIYMRIKANGIVNGSEKTIGYNEMVWMKQQAQDRMEFFRQRMIEEVIWNSNNYPLVYNISPNFGMLPHLGQNAFYGVHLPNGRLDAGQVASQLARSGVGYYSGPEYACLYGGY